MTRSHQPTDEMRKTVEAMSSYGIPHEGIACVIDIDEKTLRKYYRSELDKATFKANAQVAGKLYKKCMDGDTTSIIFWLKTRARWRESFENINKNLNVDVMAKDMTPRDIEKAQMLYQQLLKD